MKYEFDLFIDSKMITSDTPIADHFKAQVESMEIPESLEKLIKRLQTPER